MQDGKNLVLYLKNPAPRQVLAILGGGSTNAWHELGFWVGEKTTPESVSGTFPDWDSLTIEDLFPWIKDIADRLGGFLDSYLINPLQSASDNVAAFIDTINAKIQQMQEAIDELNNFLEMLKNLLPEFDAYILWIKPEVGGNAGFVSRFLSAGGDVPMSGTSDITMGVVLLFGGPLAITAYAAFHSLLG